MRQTENLYIQDPWNRSPGLLNDIQSAVFEFSRVLRPDGSFLSITFDQPHFRLPMYAKPQFGWNVQMETIGQEMPVFCFGMQKGTILLYFILIYDYWISVLVIMAYGKSDLAKLNCTKMFLLFNLHNYLISYHHNPVTWLCSGIPLQLPASLRAKLYPVEQAEKMRNQSPRMLNDDCDEQFLLSIQVD